MKTIVEDLEEQVEYWRDRAERAEQAMRGGAVEAGNWCYRVAPLTLFQTRLMRLLAVGPMNTSALMIVMENDYPRTSDESMKVHLCRIRRMLPEHISPGIGSPCPSVQHFYSVPDRPALRAFLDTGVLPVVSVGWAA